MTRRNAALSALSFEFFLSSQTPKLKYIVGGTINFLIFFLSFSCLFDFPVDGFCWFITPLSFMFSTTCLCTSHSPPFVFVRTRLVFAPITRLLLSLRASFCLCTNRRSWRKLGKTFTMILVLVYWAPRYFDERFEPSWLFELTPGRQSIQHGSVG